jgi:hypothetical protein
MTELPLNLVGFDSAATAAANKVAFQAGLDQMAAKARGGTLIVPQGLHDCDGGLSFNADRNITIQASGKASRVDFVSDTFGLSLNAQNESAMVRDVEMNAKDTGAGFLKILSVRGLSKSGTRVDRIKMQTLGTAAATVGIEVGQTQTFGSEGCWGRFAGGAVTEGYAADGAGYMFDLVGEIGPGTDYLIEGNRVELAGAIARIRPNGVTGSPKLEGITFRDNTGVGVARGYDLVGDISGAYRAPLFRFLGGHINAKNYGVYVNGVAQVRVEDILIYIEGLVGGTPVHIENTTDVKIIGNRILNLGSADFSAIYVTTSNGGDILENWFQSAGNSYMVTLQAAAVNFDVGGNKYRRTSGAGPVYENLGGASNIDRGGNRLI